MVRIEQLQYQGSNKSNNDDLPHYLITFNYTYHDVITSTCSGALRLNSSQHHHLCVTDISTIPPTVAQLVMNSKVGRLASSSLDVS